ncbi:hypothetical protein HX13_06515 [Chryseobacterium sp. P1-3]|uniref:DUF2147 domain-containing protein n=1 Tax=Chryseobacterium gallinarum TaxID=1324352 RepID=A0A0G3M7U7_CHRGL|nr:MULTISPECIES: hypothetical protein [Chryseobacterium]AKK74655.1 hypothetical protein OK18_20385 [Chryseobacterium gallinarum]KFF75717.1 hypothetical protein HX13_06515 [Chryseobacterium sp. P1-3]MCL8538499.1 hypothetical protein [Chryseobacterium gallinarum]QIY89541.1 hypothetical protein FOB44_02235 [Chryseobacterium gallinarum]
MNKLVFFFILATHLVWGQMPDISNVWLNNSKPYIGTIGSKGQELKLKINTSEQNKKNDQEYFVSGYSLVDTNYTRFEGKITILKYKDAKRQGTVFGEYELAEENKGKHSGLFKGKFVYNLKWNKKTEKVEGQYIELTGDWRSYDGTLDFKTRLKNQ